MSFHFPNGKSTFFFLWNLVEYIKDWNPVLVGNLVSSFGGFFKHHASRQWLSPRLGAEECWVGGDDDQVWVLRVFLFSEVMMIMLAFLMIIRRISKDFCDISGWCFGT